jgi:cystathionine beta-lyase
MISTPVYYPFSNSIRNNDRNIVASELVNTNGHYHVDFEDFESKIRDNNVRAFMLCSPHNPVCRVWTEDELKTMLDICRKYDVAVIADEIHQDIVFGDNRHIPALSLSGENDRMIMFAAASKTFNIAALQNSFVVIRNGKLRDQWDEFMAGLRINQGNAMGYVATEAAFKYGKGWLDEVLRTIRANYDYLCESFAENLPGVVMTPLEGTYLAWADFGACLSPEEIQPFMQDRCGLAFDYGSWFGGESSGSFIRINLATSRTNIEEMANRIIQQLTEFRFKEAGGGLQDDMDEMFRFEKKMV